ncbi:MAG: hypothetical protein ACLUSP_00900 [Christensenellales bacterium]
MSLPLTRSISGLTSISIFSPALSTENEGRFIGVTVKRGGKFGRRTYSFSVHGKNAVALPQFAFKNRNPRLGIHFAEPRHDHAVEIERKTDYIPADINLAPVLFVRTRDFCALFPFPSGNSLNAYAGASDPIIATQKQTALKI